MHQYGALTASLPPQWVEVPPEKVWTPACRCHRRSGMRALQQSARHALVAVCNNGVTRASYGRPSPILSLNIYIAPRERQCHARSTASSSDVGSPQLPDPCVPPSGTSTPAASTGDSSPPSLSASAASSDVDVQEARSNTQTSATANGSLSTATAA